MMDIREPALLPYIPDYRINLISPDPRFLSVEQKASQVIKVITGSEFKINEKEEEINMCKALEDLKEEGREEGREFAKREFVRKLLAKKQFTYEEIFDMTDVPVDEIQKIERHKS